MRPGPDGQVYRNMPNDPPIEDDWGYAVVVTPAELLELLREAVGRAESDR